MLLFNHRDGWGVWPQLLSSTSPPYNLYLDGIGIPRYPFCIHLALGIRVASIPPPGRESAPDSLAGEALITDSPRDSAQSTLNDVPNHDVSSVLSGKTAHADAPRRVDPEKGKDTLLVEWYGPTDPDVSYRCVMLVLWLLIGIVIFFRILRTGRVRRKHGSCSRHVF
jgi:hypothetical protein